MTNNQAAPCGCRYKGRVGCSSLEVTARCDTHQQARNRMLARRSHLRYLNRTQVAQRLGITPGALSRYKLPPPDATIGDVRGWHPDTIDQWNADRPGRGARTDLRKPTA